MTYRITVYHPDEDICAILDSNGAFEKLWQFSVFLREKGFKIIDATNSDKYVDVDMNTEPGAAGKITLRACNTGEPEQITHKLNGKAYPAIKVNSAIYIPEKTA